MPDHHGADEELDHDTLHITVGGYVTGFVLSVILTAIPFWLVMGKVFASSTVTIFVILGLAIVQIYVHMVFFLHMTSNAEGGWPWISREHRRRASPEPAPPESEAGSCYARHTKLRGLTPSAARRVE